MSSRARRVASFSVLGVGIVAALRELLPSLDLRPWVEHGFTLSAALAVLAFGLWRDRVAARAADDELRTTLDDALACWPPRTAAALTPYDLGCHPTGDDPPHGADGPPPEALPRYVARETDDALREAIEQAPIALVYGPPRAGKSRSIYEALRDRLPDAKLLVPEDADGLRTVLAHVEELPRLIHSRQPTRLVIWLDELARFLPGLDLDALDRLATGSAPVQLVATIGEQELRGLLAEGDASEARTDRHRARRLLARARAIHLPAPSAAEVAAARAGALAARLGGAGWHPAPVRDVTPIRRPPRFTPLLGLVSGATLAVLLATVGYAIAQGSFRQPSPLADQVAALRDGGQECEHPRSSPTDAAAVGKRTVVVLAVRRESCPGSDEMRLYRDRAERLDALPQLHPPDVPARRFACIGADPADPCAVLDEHDERLLVGAFEDPGQNLMLPIAVHPVQADEHLAAIGPPPPPGRAPIAPAARRAAGRARMLPLDGRALGDGDACDAAHRCVVDHGAQAWVALSATGARPALLVAGYLARGSDPLAPRALVLRAWRLVSRGAAPVVRQRCWIYTDGRRVRQVAHLGGNGDELRYMAVAWQALASARRSAVVC